MPSMAAGWLIVAAALGQVDPASSERPLAPEPIPYWAATRPPAADNTVRGASVVQAVAWQEARRQPPGIQRPGELTQLRALDEVADPAPAPPVEGPVEAPTSVDPANAPPAPAAPSAAIYAPAPPMQSYAPPPAAIGGPAVTAERAPELAG